jgi:nucleoside permease NupC
VEKKEDMPSWAYWGLWGINTRKMALGFVVITALISLILIPVGVMVNDYSLIAFVFVPVWYWLSLKWADNNSAWPSKVNS